MEMERSNYLLRVRNRTTAAYPETVEGGEVSRQALMSGAN